MYSKLNVASVSHCQEDKQEEESKKCRSDKRINDPFKSDYWIFKNEQRLKCSNLETLSVFFFLAVSLFFHQYIVQQSKTKHATDTFTKPSLEQPLSSLALATVMRLVFQHTSQHVETLCLHITQVGCVSMFRGCYWIILSFTGETTDLDRAEWKMSLTPSIQRKSLQCPHVFLPGMLLTIIHPLLRISWKNWMNLQNNFLLLEWVQFVVLSGRLYYAAICWQILSTVSAPKQISQMHLIFLFPFLFCYLIFSKKYLLYTQTETRLQTSCDSCVGDS